MTPQTPQVLPVPPSLHENSVAVLVCGGSFDPPHEAHIRLPRLAAQRLGCDRLLFIPASINPLKRDHPPAPAHHRLAMLKLAIEQWPCEPGDGPAGEIDTIEIDRGGPSYTIETLEMLAQRLGRGVRIHLLIGSDAAFEFERWKDWERILELATPAVLLRPPLDRASFEAQLALRKPAEWAQRWRTWVVELPPVDASATRARALIREGKWGSAEPLLGPAVLDYIRRHGLYRT
jgi:nicotinate-nucleotide adenylyltransferase